MLQATLKPGWPCTPASAAAPRALGPVGPARGIARRAASAFATVGPAVGLQVVFVTAASLLLGYVLVSSREFLAVLGTWGYVGVAVAELANSAAVIVPTPAPAYVFAMGAVQNPILIGVVGGLAAAIGELVGYYLGARGRLIAHHGGLYRRLQSLTLRWGGRGLFAFAVLPVPFDVAGIWAGAVGYPVGRFLIFVTLGKTIKVLTIALAGYYGVRVLF